MGSKSVPTVGDSSMVDHGVSVYRAEILKDVLQISPSSTASIRGHPLHLQNSDGTVSTSSLRAHRRLDVHDLDPGEIGTFDLVFCAGVLYHTRHPLLALEKIRSVTAGRLILVTHQLIPAMHGDVPMIRFFPGDGRAAKGG